MTIEETDFPMTFSGSGQCPCGEELECPHLLWRFGRQQIAVVAVCCHCYHDAPLYAWGLHLLKRGNVVPWVRLPEA